MIGTFLAARVFGAIDTSGAAPVIDLLPGHHLNRAPSVVEHTFTATSTDRSIRNRLNVNPNKTFRRRPISGTPAHQQRTTGASIHPKVTPKSTRSTVQHVSVDASERRTTCRGRSPARTAWGALPVVDVGNPLEQLVRFAQSFRPVRSRRRPLYSSPSFKFTQGPRRSY
jgi:hypothetical protein